MRFLVGSFFLIGLVFSTQIAFAQPGPPPDPDVPLGGIELLIAAGAAFGAKKWFDKNKKK